MTQACSQFATNIEEVRKTHLITTGINISNSPIVDTANLFRSCVLLSVSALDHLIHELTIAGMKEIFNGSRTPTSKYNKHSVSLGFVSAINSTPSMIVFESEIRKTLSWQTFQRPEKIKDAISLFSAIQLWQQISLYLNDSESNIKNQLNLIVDRRNMIAHEADIEPVFKTKRQISDSDVQRTIDYIDKLGNAIYSVVK
jgi:hypothetical protein